MIVKKALNHVFLQLLVLLVFDQSSVLVYPPSLLVSICIVFNIWEMKTWTTHHVVLRFYCNGTRLDWAGHERFLSTSTN